MSPEAELGVPGSTKRENRKFPEALWDFLSLLGLLHKSYSDPSLFQEALGVLRVSHSLVQVIHVFLPVWGGSSHSKANKGWLTRARQRQEKASFRSS
jgi:hypothetical protein